MQVNEINIFDRHLATNFGPVVKEKKEIAMLPAVKAKLLEGKKDKETTICIVDDTGKIVREVKVVSEPQALLALKNPVYHFKRIGLEAGPLSQWLFSALADAELRAASRR